MADDERSEKRGKDDAERARMERDSESAAKPEGGREPGGGMRDARHGIPGKGFDAGTGYGGAGGSSAYSGESSYGGQAGYGGSTTRGAYAGGQFGRPDDPGGAFAGRGEGAAASGEDADATGGSDTSDGVDAANGGDPDATGGSR